MNSSVGDPEKIAASYHAWWRDAGVDYVCGEDQVNWLDAAGAPVVSAPVIEEPTKPKRPSVVAPPVLKAEAAWPETLADLKSAIAGGAALPGCGYGTTCVAPIGEMGARAFVLVDCPEEEEVLASHYGVGPTGTLLANMLLATKLLPDFTYRTALASSRPATNTIPKSDMAGLAAFVQHQIALIKPEIVIFLGTAVCEAMLGQELMQARANLHYLNYNDRKTAAVATFHPRTLIAQPRMKAKAWQDLLMVARKDFL